MILSGESYAARDFLNACQPLNKPVTVNDTLRLDQPYMRHLRPIAAKAVLAKRATPSHLTAILKDAPLTWQRLTCLG